MWISEIGHRIEGAAGALSRATNSVAGIVLVIMMVFVSVDVLLMRYALSRPTEGSYEIVELMMVVVVFAAVAYVGLKDGHVSIDIVVSRFPQRAQAVIELIIYLLSLGLFFMISWMGVVHGRYLQLVNMGSLGLEIPLAPFLYVVAFGSALFSLVLLVKAVRSAAQVVRSSHWLWVLLGGVLVLVFFTVPVWLHWLKWEISPTTVGLIGLSIMILFIFLKVPVGFAMGLVGFIGVGYLVSMLAGNTLLKTVPFSTTYSYELSVLPLFIVMGYFAFHSGLSRDLYYSVYRWVGHLPGGLAMATSGACAGFSAITGSSMAAAATIGAVALPEMKRYKYDDALATGCVAAGGTLGNLIPPSVGFIIYGLITSQSIGRLFIAGFLPGLLVATSMMMTSYTLCRRNPLLGPRGPEVNLGQKLRALGGAWPPGVIFVIVIGGIYLGVFTPTEAAAVGAVAGFFFLVGKRALTRQSFTSSINDAAQTNGMVMTILIGAMMLGHFLALSGLPYALTEFIAGLEVNRYIILAGFFLMYIFLGCIMDFLALIFITVPIIFPIVVSLGFDPIWFGVVMIMLGETGLITPPVGLNVYVIAGVAKDVPMTTIFRGIVPFLVAIIICIILVTAFPQIALFLPGIMY